MNIIIKRADHENDAVDAYRLIQELAEYENEPDAVTNSLAQFIEDGFGKKPIYKLWLAKHDSKTVGMALCFTSYSTWKGKMLYLDDLVVTESYRRKGIGKLLLNALVEHAKSNDYRLIKWQVLDWNEPAINFYKKVKVVFDDAWLDCKVYQDQYEEFLKIK